MMGNTGSTGFFGGLGQVAKLVARAIGLGILAVLIGIIVGALTSWKFGLLTFAVIGLVAAYYFFRALRQQARNFNAVGSFASDLMQDIQRDDSLLSGSSPGFDDDFSPLFGTTPRRPSRSTAPRYPASSSQSTGSSASTTSDISDGVPFHKTGSGTDNSAHDGHTIHQDSSGHSSSPSDSSSTGSSDGGGSSSSTID